MWKVLSDRALGTSHKLSGLPCQDAELSTCYKTSDQEILFLCCSDGAGSAGLSHKGSEAACLGLWLSIEQTLSSGTPLNQLTRDHIVSWYRETAAILCREAESLNVQPRELACTLLGALVGNDSSVFFQLGDGAIVTSSEGGYRPVFWPQSGEYVNETNFLTDSNLEGEVLFEIRQTRINEIALFTDGLQPMVLDYAQKSAHPDFFSTMFKTLHAGNVNDLGAPFKQFLNSSKVNERTDDDKSLLLAVRVDDHATDTL